MVFYRYLVIGSRLGISSDGIISGQVSPFNIPMPALPGFPVFDYGNSNITVNGSMALPPGEYKTVNVKNNAELTLTDGEYMIKQLLTGKNAKILYQDDVILKIRDEMKLDKNTAILPSQSGADMFIYIETEDVKIDKECTIQSGIYVFAGKADIDKECEIYGSVIAREIEIDKNCTLIHIPVCWPLFDNTIPLPVFNGDEDDNDCDNCSDKSLIFSVDQKINNEEKKEFAVYPVPSSDKVYFGFNAKQGSNIKITLYNSLNNHVAVITDGIGKIPGKKSLLYDTSNLPAGMYYSVFESAGETIVKKLIIIK